MRLVFCVIAGACLLSAGGLAVQWLNQVVPPCFETDRGSPPYAGIGISTSDALDRVIRLRQERASKEAKLDQVDEEIRDLHSCSDLGEFVRRFPATLRAEPVFQTALARWVELSPGAALQWLYAHGEYERFSHLADLAASNWADKDPLLAVEWTQRQPTKVRPHLLARLAIGFALTDPRLAAEFAHSLLFSGPERQHADEGIADTWGKSDPTAAASWTLNNVSEDSRQEIMSLVLYSWYAQSPEAVNHWISQLADSNDRDAIRIRVLGWQMEKNPAEAVAMIDQISDDVLRAQATVSLVGKWARDDLPVASEWVRCITSAPLRTELMAELAIIGKESVDRFR